MENAVLVTGGSTSIGLAIVERLESEGYQPIILDKVPPKEMRGRIFEQVDLSDAAMTAGTLEHLVARYPITRLVNNVGVAYTSELGRDTPENLRRTAAVNFGCPFLCVKAVLPAMTAARFGRIVNISSRGAFGKELRLAYNATKGGINTVTRSWALEFADRGITVNAVAPGATDTDLYRRNNPPDAPLSRRTLASIPMGRLGQPSEIAEAVAFFLSAKNGYVTGQLLFVCGGLSIGTNPSG